MVYEEIKWNYVQVCIEDNHVGHIEFEDLNSINQLKDDEVINVIVKNLKNP